jgi:dCTP deaminase
VQSSAQQQAIGAAGEKAPTKKGSMNLSDIDIFAAIRAQGLEIDPAPEEQAFQPSSVDLKLGPDFLIPYAATDAIPTTADRNVRYAEIELHGADHFVLRPGAAVICRTLERVHVPSTLVGKVEGKSSLGRMFLFVHATAGFVDPGFDGTITLECFNAASYPIALVIGSYICQIRFEQLLSKPSRLYGDPRLRSRYQGQQQATGAKR